MHDGVDCGQRKQVPVLQVARNGRGAQGAERPVGRRRACQRQHLMTVLHKLRDQVLAKEAGASGSEDLHWDASFVLGSKTVSMACSRRLATTAEVGASEPRRRAVT